MVDKRHMMRPLRQNYSSSKLRMTVRPVRKMPKRRNGSKRRIGLGLPMRIRRVLEILRIGVSDAVIK